VRGPRAVTRPRHFQRPYNRPASPVSPPTPYIAFVSDRTDKNSVAISLCSIFDRIAGALRGYERLGMHIHWACCVCAIRRLSGNYDARPLSVSLFSDASCSRLRASVSIIGRKSLHPDLALRLLAPYVRERYILSEPPNKQALRFAQDSALRSGRDRSCPLSIRLETPTKMRSPMRHSLHPLGRVHATQAMECADINT
jgi:hypothetical protein